MGGDESREDDEQPIHWAGTPLSSAEILAQALVQREEEARAADANNPIQVPPFEATEKAKYDMSLAPADMLAALPYDTPTAITQLFRELEVTRVVAIAGQGVWQDLDGMWSLDFLVVPTWVWHYDLSEDHDFWKTGFLFKGFPTRTASFNSPQRWIKLFDVRFSIERVPHLAASRQSTIEQTTHQPADVGVIAPRAGGRPPKPFWDDLWVEMCRQLYEGDLKPVRQADVEKAMADWLTSQEHSASEGAIRDRARRLFAAVKPEDKN